MMNSRKIKIHRRYQQSSHHLITVPEIRLRGKWLDELGFGEGKTVHIQQKKNKLTITLAKQHH
ncbi:SymE family type I addiction module toxin [Chryseobacterium profundimaris]|uniref:Toxic protein SymE n=1 Tax=Chryseobacterium profundimaris TaxID=1387275 RepID=A0ABY1NUT5_9FLAO|nr:SymE family type I addiction module toxin [Chryseobacterium profundimaris]SMP17501.1 toxic protein SymE [Chryseobacterium profundimaris]